MKMRCIICGNDSLKQVIGIYDFIIEIEGKKYNCKTGRNPYYCNVCKEYYLTKEDMVENIIKIKKEMDKK